jgi:hypothetical protein
MIFIYFLILILRLPFCYHLKHIRTYLSCFFFYLKADLKNVGGVYGLININDKKQYIGSSLNMYERLTDNIKGVSSNVRL